MENTTHTQFGKSLLTSSIALGLVATALVAAPVFAQDVGVSISIGHPGFYGRINACGERVYFVQDAWYANVYAPHYRERHGHHDGDDSRGEGRNHGHGHGKGHKN